MTDRANAALRLLHLSQQIEALAERIRQGWNPEDSHTLWMICGAYERLRTRLHEETIEVTKHAAPRGVDDLRKIFQEAA